MENLSHVDFWSLCICPSLNFRFGAMSCDKLLLSTPPFNWGPSETRFWTPSVPFLDTVYLGDCIQSLDSSITYTQTPPSSTFYTTRTLPSHPVPISNCLAALWPLELNMANTERLVFPSQLYSACMPISANSISRHLVERACHGGFVFNSPLSAILHNSLYQQILLRLPFIHRFLHDIPGPCCSMPQLLQHFSFWLSISTLRYSLISVQNLATSTIGSHDTFPPLTLRTSSYPAETSCLDFSKLSVALFPALSLSSHFPFAWPWVLHLPLQESKGLLFSQ